MLTGETLMAFIATTQPERARKFYVEVLGLRLVADEEYALVFDAHGIVLRVQKVQSFLPHPYTALGWQVRDIAGTIAGLRKKGVEFLRFPYFAQDEAGVWNAPGGAKVAWFKDPDDNTLSLTQFPAASTASPARKS